MLEMRRHIGKPAASPDSIPKITGTEAYLDDLKEQNVHQVVFVRSPHPHARIRSIECQDALRLDGVLGFFSAEGLGVRQVPVTVTRPGLRAAPRPLMAGERVRFEGEIVGAIVARDIYTAEDAAEKVSVDYEPLPAVIDIEESLGENAPRIYEEWDSNSAFHHEIHVGDRNVQGRDVFEEKLRLERCSAAPIEARGVLARYEPSRKHLTLHSSTQVPHTLRSALAFVLGFPENQIRVVAPAVGGAFGAKQDMCAEEGICAWLAMRLGVPVKWLENRRESLTACTHARSQVHRLKVSVDPGGMIVCFEDRYLADIGAYIEGKTIGPHTLTANLLPGPYAIRNYHVELDLVVTNKVTSYGYRGFGHPQAAYVMERMMDIIARETGLDAAEVRQRNMIRALPYTSPTGMVYDSGDYVSCLSRALDVSGYGEFRKRQGQLRRSGEQVGIGIGNYVEVTGLGPSKYMGLRGYTDAPYAPSGYESATVRVDSLGNVEVATGMSSQGQGVEMVLRQICAEELGVDDAGISVTMGDTATSPRGQGAFASRGAVVAGGAVAAACAKIRDKATRTAAVLLKASQDSISYDKESARVVESSGAMRSLSLADLARALFTVRADLAGMEPGLDSTVYFDPEATSFAYGTAIAKVSVDLATGEVNLLDYVHVHDCGTIVNPANVTGQIIGGAVQGIGEALLEELRFGDGGALLTGTFADYLIPSATSLPPMLVEHLETPSPHTYAGIKGVGEAGIIPPLAAIANAVNDALATVCQEQFNEIPITAPKLWEWLRNRAANAER